MVERTDLNPDNPLAADMRAPVAALTENPTANADRERQRTIARRMLSEMRARFGANMDGEILREMDSLEAEVNNPFGDFTNLSERLNSLASKIDSETAVTRSNTEAYIGDLAQETANARLQLLDEGRVGEYYLEHFDREHLYSAESRTQIAALVNNDPVVREKAAQTTRLPHGARARAEARIAADEQQLADLIASSSGPLRNQYVYAQRLGIVQDETVARELFQANGDPQRIQSILDRGYADRGQELSRNPHLQPGTGVYLQLLRIPELVGPDGRTLDFTATSRYWVEHKDEIAALRNRMNAGESLNERERALVTLDGVVNIANAEYGLDRLTFRTMREIARDNPEQFQSILDNSRPAAERAQQLATVITERIRAEHAGQPINAAQIAADARAYITLFDSNSGAREAVLQERQSKEVFDNFKETYGSSLSAMRVNNGLSDMGFNAEQISQLNQAAGQYPELRSVLDNSFLTDSPVLPVERQRILFNNILTNGGPENQQALSILNYYNLTGTYEGSQIQSNIYLGNVDAQTALRQTEELRGQALTRMQAYAGFVPQSFTAQQTEILRNAGLIDANGNADVANLIERARINRDALGPLTDAQLAAITSRPESELTPQQLENRVIAQAAVRFKVIDAFQSFASEINTASNRLGAAQDTPQLRADIELYNRMVNADGTFSVEEQRGAIDQFLQRQQYLRTTDTLRGRMVDYVVNLNNTTNVLRSADFASADLSGVSLNDYVPASAPDATAPTPTTAAPVVPAAEVDDHHHTREELRAMRNEGITPGDRLDGLFQNKMEDRIQDVLNKMDMSQIVTTFGSLLGVYNVGHLDNVTHHEIENALRAAGKTDLSQIGNGDNKLTAQEIVDVLREANFNPPQTAITVAGNEQTAPASTPASSRPQTALGVAG